MFIVFGCHGTWVFPIVRRACVDDTFGKVGIMIRTFPWLVLSTSLLLLPAPANSQIDVSSVTARLGVIRTLQIETDDGGHMWSFYPELQAGGVFFTASVSWGLSWGYWTDGLDHGFDWADHVTYSQKGHVFVLRVGFDPQKVAPHWPIPVKIFGGAAEHIIVDRYVAGTDLTGRHGTGATHNTTTLCGGLSFDSSISSRLQLEAEVEQFFPIGSEAYDYAQEDRRNFKLGIVVGI